MMAAVIIALITTVLTNVEGCLYYKEQILENHFREPLSEGENHCGLLWVRSKGDKLSDRKANV